MKRCRQQTTGSENEWPLSSTKETEEFFFMIFFSIVNNVDIILTAFAVSVRPEFDNSIFLLLSKSFFQGSYF